MRYRFGDWVLDTLCYELQRSGEAVPLRPKAFQVLAYLLAHRDRVVSKQELLDSLWPGQFVEEVTLNSCIMAVRKTLGDSGQTPRFVHTVRGRGFRFVAPVQEEGPTRSRSPLVSGSSPERAWSGAERSATLEAGPSAVAAPSAEDEVKPKLLGIPFETPSFTQLSPQARKARTFTALHQVSQHASRRQPLVLAVENLHCWNGCPLVRMAGDARRATRQHPYPGARDVPAWVSAAMAGTVRCHPGRAAAPNGA
jgi:DNA-binding winged helix-turn-helix (wHTH) protein